MLILEIVILVFLGLVEVVCVGVLIGYTVSAGQSQKGGAVFVPIPKRVIKNILAFGEISNNDVLYDLGCGDARVLITGVRDFGVRNAVGYDVAWWPRLWAGFKIKRYKLDDKIKILKTNLKQADITKASVVYLYLFPELARVAGKIIAEKAKSGTKIISVSFDPGGPVQKELSLLKSGKIDRFNVWLYQKV